MLLSECVQALNDDDWDGRGDIFNSQLSGSMFMTVNAPNSGSDTTLCQGPNSKQLPGPCVDQFADARAVYNTARSRHSGGVMVVFGDGSTRFVANEISLPVWQALGTMNSGETIPASALSF
jgi:prepilin-type processing-associated H-X9-DG protein